MNSLPLVTTTQRSTFRRCPQRGVWRFYDGYSAKGDKPDALWFGTGIHIALAEWYKLGYKRGTHPADTFIDWVGNEFREIRSSGEEWDDFPKYEDAQELGVAMLESYIDEYGRDEDWYILAIEQPFKARITHQGNPIAIFMSAWDGVMRSKRSKRVYLIEHKTASQISTAYLELDDQGGIYWAIASEWLRNRGIIKPDEYIAGIVYNFLRKAMPDGRPRDDGGAYLNQDGSVSKRQPAPLFKRHIVERSPGEQRQQLRRLREDIVIMEGIRNGSIPVTKNTTRDCTYCEFFDMCVLHEHGGEAWKKLAGSLYTREDPYARYRKSSGE